LLCFPQEYDWANSAKHLGVVEHSMKKLEVAMLPFDKDGNSSNNNSITRLHTLPFITVPIHPS
jgi:hypothetical protein